MKNWFKKYGYIFIVALPFVLMNLAAYAIGWRIDYFRAEMVLPSILFAIAYIALFTGLSLLIKGIWGKIVYCVLFAISFIMLVANCVYISFTGYYFSFNLVLMASEGGEYIWDAILSIKLLMIPMLILIIVSFIFGLKKLKRPEKFYYKPFIILIVAFVVLKISTPLTYGKGNTSLGWDTWRNPRNVYENFYDANKNFRVCGLYEYIVRDFYVTFLRPEEPDDPAELKILEEDYASFTKHAPNDLTGTCTGKNVIFLQLEGMDDWLLNETDTPNLYRLMKEGINFTNHYSYYNGGGSTFNSELAVNTGFITPITYVRNAYTFNTNDFRYSLPNQFKNLGYRANVFHMNTEEYYSRGINYKNWGYDDYNSLWDDNHYTDLSYHLDRELILNKGFYDNMFKGTSPFMHSIITFTPHMPFETTDDEGKILAKEQGITKPLSEEESARLFVAETDNMVGLLIQALKDNGLYDNTVIVAYADHYIYTFSDYNIQRKYKDTSTNLVNHTPFFIWSSDIKPMEVTKVNSQLDILPTVLNMFGIEYNNEWYIGNDIFDDSYQGYAFFSDYSWYDGQVYVSNGEIKKGSGLSKEELLKMNEKIADVINRNDLTLKYDYFRRLNK